MSKNNPLIAIIGPTASGKTALALKLAQQYNGEIIAGDSRTVYRGLDIGTAKPTITEQGLVRHHVLDIAGPGEIITAQRFQALAYNAIDDIHSRNKVPFMVGGSGMYLDSVLFNYQFPRNDPDLRQLLQRKTLVELQEEVDAKGIMLNSSDYANRVRLIRVLETAGSPRSKTELRENTLVIGIEMPRNQLEARFRRRIDHMMQAGMLDEVKWAAENYGADSQPFTGCGYKPLFQVVEGEISKAEGVEAFVRSHLALAKKQMTWFRRNPHIKWINRDSEAEELVADFLKKL